MRSLGASFVLAGSGGGRPARGWAAPACDASGRCRARIGDLTTGAQQRMTTRTARLRANAFAEVPECR